MEYLTIDPSCFDKCRKILSEAYPDLPHDDPRFLPKEKYPTIRENTFGGYLKAVVEIMASSGGRIEIEELREKFEQELGTEFRENPFQNTVDFLSDQDYKWPQLEAQAGAGSRLISSRIDFS